MTKKDLHEYDFNIEGPFNIENGSRIKEIIKNAIAKFNTVIINQTGDEYIDLTYVQIILASIKSTEILQKKISFKCKNIKSLIQFVNNTGVSAVLPYIKVEELGEKYVE